MPRGEPKTHNQRKEENRQAAVRSRKRVRDQWAQLRQENEELRAQNAALRDRIRQLESRDRARQLEEQIPLVPLTLGEDLYSGLDAIPVGFVGSPE